MSEIIDKLTYLEGTKALLKSKLKAGDNVPFRDYPGLLQGPKEWSQAEYDATFAKANARPADWLPMPAFTEGEQKVALLVAVYDDDSEYVAFKAAGAYTVDWGDGSAAENFATGVTAQHKYEYSALPSASLCSEGYRQAMMVVTPQAGNNLTSVTLTAQDSVTSRMANYVEAVVSGPSISSISAASHAKIKRFSLVGANSIANFSSMFSGCYALTAVPLLNTANGTDFSYMFYYCYALTAIPQLDTAKGTNFYGMFYYCLALTAIPLIDTANCTNFYGMFYGCQALTAIPLLNTANGTNFYGMFNGCYALTAVPQLDTSKGTNFYGMFQSCQSLTTVPQLNTANGTNFANMFQSCQALTAVPLIDTANGTGFYGMFNGCHALTAVPLIDTAKGTNFSAMFNGCLALTSVPLIDTSNGTDFTNMFSSCQALTAVPQLDTAKGTGFTNMFHNCQSLSRMRATGFKISFSIASCKLSRTELVSIFTSLPTVTGQTITVTGNFGAASLTAEDRAIATAKGWTVTA